MKLQNDLNDILFSLNDGQMVYVGLNVLQKSVS